MTVAQLFDINSDELFDVAIVGYGPVGATLANLLGQFGWRTVVFERDTDIYPVPRAVHMDDEALRILQAAGVMGDIQPALGGYPKHRQYLNAKGNVFFETFRNDQAPFGYPSNTYFHQPLLEKGLRQGVDRFDHVQVCLGVEVLNVEPARGTNIPATVTVQTTIKDKDSSSGQTINVQAKFVIGCDGGRSVVRKSLGIVLDDLKFEQPWLVTDFYLKEGVTLADTGLIYAHQQHCNPQQPMSFIPTSVKSHYRWEFMLLDGQTKEEVEQPDYVRQMLSLVVDPERIDLVRAAVYTFHSLIATQWRVGNCFIAGDAAHQMPPFAGQGMCSGFRDVQNLAWKLDLVLTGRLSAAATETLLDTYQMERLPHVTRMTRGTMFLGNLVQTRSPMRAFIRDLLFKTVLRIPRIFGRLAHFALRSPNLKAGILSSIKRSDTAKGTYFIQPEVQTNDTVALLDDVLGVGFALLWIGDTLDTAILQAIQAHNLSTAVSLHCIHIRQSMDNSGDNSPLITTLCDHTGKLGAWFETHQVDTVLIRPDRYVFGVYTLGTGKQSIEDILTDLSGAI
ncbi:MAG: bifunctional 3-(3-hydroxy-phenyl)propionate/3-hydroxycinnamic acid hydroxylase [Chloroflexota bacterium]